MNDFVCRCWVFSLSHLEVSVCMCACWLLSHSTSLQVVPKTTAGRTLRSFFSSTLTSNKKTFFRLFLQNPEHHSCASVFYPPEKIRGFRKAVGSSHLKESPRSTSCHCPPTRSLWAGGRGKRAWIVCASAAEQLRAGRRHLRAREAASDDHVCRAAGRVLRLHLLGESSGSL